MKKQHRLLSIILAGILAFGMVPLMVYADDGASAAAQTETLAVAADEAGEAAEAGVLADEAGAAIADVENNTVTATTKWEDYYLTPSSDQTATFNVITPGKGVLLMDVADIGEYKFSVKIKTKGFKDYEYLYADTPRLTLGVKKGTYKFDVNTYAETCAVRIKFVKFKEGKYGTSKKKAKSITRGKVRNGLIITDNKKVHWYKIKHTNTKAFKITVKSAFSNGGTYGGYKITVYQGSHNIGEFTKSASIASNVIEVSSVLSSKKAAKGTYYVKIQSYNGGNGKFTVKWK